MRFINKIFNVEEDHGKKSQKITWTAKELKSTVIPTLSLLIKDQRVQRRGRTKD